MVTKLCARYSAKGIIFGKPKDEQYYEEYKHEILLVMKEHHLEDLPVLYNLNFGHTEPKFILPYGAMAEIDCENVFFYFREWRGMNKTLL